LLDQVESLGALTGYGVGLLCRCSHAVKSTLTSAGCQANLDESFRAVRARSRFARIASRSAASARRRRSITFEWRVADLAAYASSTSSLTFRAGFRSRLFGMHSTLEQ
jgi:hypothetical protein